MAAKLECPKCHGFSWLKVEGPDIIQQCLCGLHKYLYTELEGGLSISHSYKPDPKNLPRAGTKLSQCLGTLCSLMEATTGEVAEAMDQNSSDTASQLTVLQAKGLVERLTEKRGIAGGSRWTLTRMAIELYAIK